MSPTFLSLSSAWLFALLVPLIGLYFLKLKRPRQLVPSLVLWRQVMNDQRVNSPFQRFKRNLLLLLQILLLTLLVLAAMQPLLRRQTLAAGRLPVLIDCSASMAALDQPSGISRLESAKTRVRSLLAGLATDQEISLVAFSKNARRLTGFTNNTRELREALDAIEVEDVPGDLEEALRLAQGLARTAPFERVLLLSDGNFPAKTNFELPFKIDFQRVEPAGSNFGITACTARRGLSGQWEIFVQLSGSPAADATGGTVELRQDDAVVATENVTLVPGSSPRLVFQITTQNPTAVEVRFRPSGFDSLTADNAAWLDLPAPRPLEVFVSPALTAFRHALAGLDGVRVWPAENETAPTAFDLAITDQPSEVSAATRVICTVGFVPPALAKMVAIQGNNTSAVDWRRDSPLLQHVLLDDVVFSDDPHTAPNLSETDFANAGYSILAQGSHGPLLVERHDREGWRIHALFHPDHSTLPFRVGFPIFVSNLVQAAQRESKLAETSAISTGTLPPLSMRAHENYRFEGPAHLQLDVQSDGAGQLTGLAAPRAGRYVIKGPGAEALHIGASLLSASETGLAGVDQIEFSDQLKVQAAIGPVVKAERALWWPLACAGFFVLLAEWWYFQRRPVLAR